MKRLRIKPLFHVEVLSPEGVYLLSERAHAVVHGGLVCALAPLLDGTLTADEIVDRLPDGVSLAEGHFTLHQLQERGYVEEVIEGLSAARAAFWQTSGLPPEESERRIDAAEVSVVAFGATSPSAVITALAGAGIATTESGSLTIALTDDYLDRGLAAHNLAALASGRPWLLAKIVGTTLWIGPLLQPGKTACWECLAQRLRGNREVEAYLNHRRGTDESFPTSRAALPITLDLGADLLALEVVKLLARGLDAPSSATLTTLDLLTLEVQTHAVVRQPQCPRCGTPVRVASPVVLESSPKRFTSDGGHRSATPRETLERHGHHVSPVIGAVTELTRLSPTDDDLMHVYSSGHNFAVRNLNLHFLREGLRSKSAGKGATDAQAKASALCEALERYSGIFRGDELRKLGSFREIGAAAIAPNECMLFSDDQLDHRKEWNARGGRFQQVPLRFDESARIDWSPVWSLTRREHRYLPTAYLYYGYPSHPERFYSWGDSNGNAAGNTLEEAIFQGFLEVVERDCVAAWWYNRVQRPAVDLDSFDDPYLGEVRRRYEGLDRPLWVLDLTSDLGIPVFAAISRRRDKPAEDILMAFGAHLDPKIALRRAITEVNQFLPAVLPVGRDGKGAYAFEDPESQHWWKTATTASQPYLLPLASTPPRTLASFQYTWRDDIRDDVRACQALVEAQGMEMLVLDQTRPDIGLPVVKVIVPGMRHFWARLGPGRLYDVPVKLGWLDAPLREAELNPIPLFL
jgi:oxazoline/thiazoline synthase